MSTQWFLFVLVVVWVMEDSIEELQDRITCDDCGVKTEEAQYKDDDISLLCPDCEDIVFRLPASS